MRIGLIRGAVLLAFCSPVWTFAQTANTVISDTIVSPGGGNPSGTAIISWNRFQNDASPRQVVFPGSFTLTITNGVVSTSLFPNSVALPAGSCYKVAYSLSGVNTTRYWTVPVSSTPVNLNEIEGNFPCTPTQGSIIAPSQIVPGAPGVTQYLTSSPTGLVSWTTGGGGGGGSPGGTNGQVQYNNLGSFGGFTIGGDCSLILPNLICTSTNGVPFAPSATTNALNASNISSGTLAVGVGGTGAGAFTAGSVPFIGAGGVYTQSNSTFFWDAVNSRLCLGCNTFATSDLKLSLVGTGATTINAVAASGNNAATLNLNSGGGGSAGDSAQVRLLQNGTLRWSAGMFNASGAFSILDGGTGVSPVYIPSTDNVLIGGTTDGGYRFDVQSGQARFFNQTPTTGFTNVQFKSGAGQSANDLQDFLNNSGVLLGGVTEIGETYTTDSANHFVAQMKNGFGITLSNASFLGFSSTNQSYGSVSTALYQNAAGVIEIDNGTAGTYRDLILRNLTINGTCTGCPGAGSGFVTTSGTPSSGQMAKFSGSASITNAVAGTDYAAPTSGAAILYGNGAGGFSNVIIGTNLTFSGGTLNATGGGGGGVCPAGVRSASASTDTVLSSDNCKNISLTYTSGGVAQTLPAASGAFASPWIYFPQNNSAGTLTITTSTSVFVLPTTTASAITIPPGEGVSIWAGGDGNWHVNGTILQSGTGVNIINNQVVLDSTYAQTKSNLLTGTAPQVITPSSGACAYTFSTNPTFASYSANTPFTFIPDFSCSSSPTMNLNTLGALPILSASLASNPTLTIHVPVPLVLNSTATDFICTTCGLAAGGTRTINLSIGGFNNGGSTYYAWSTSGTGISPNSLGASGNDGWELLMSSSGTPTLAQNLWIPDDFSSTLKITFQLNDAGGGGGSVQMNVGLVCQTTGTSYTSTFTNTANTGLVSYAGANDLLTTTPLAIATSGCVAGQQATLQIYRNGGTAGNAGLVAVKLTYTSAY
jgi:hypothetical protein